MILRTCSKGHKGLRKSCPQQRFQQKYTETCKKYTLQNKVHKTTQDMLQNEFNCIQIVKLISSDY